MSEETTTDRLAEIEGQVQTITTDDVAAEALAGVWDQAQAEQQIRTLQAIMSGQAETIARLHSEIHGLNMEIGGLQAQLEAVKAELVRQCENSRRLQIDLDAREQVPTSTDDRFEQGWDAGTARAVETIAEWLEPFQTCGSQALALAVLQNLPAIMRSLTGLTDED